MSSQNKNCVQRVIAKLDLSIIESSLKSSDPLFFDSFYRQQVWGGRGLSHVLGRILPNDGPIGEAWELSSHKMHVSRVLEGVYSGKNLDDIWRSFRLELTGHSQQDSFPLLIKWLECHERLSLQVHPDDQMARQVLNEPFGKSEAWVVIEAEPTAIVYAGLKSGVTRTDVVKSVAAGTLADCLHSFVPVAGDCISLPAGTIHAAGGGLMLAEVQQSSDATFRLYDWDRLGLDGRPRPLQIEMALQAVDWNQGPISPVTPKSIPTTSSEIRAESLVESRPFQLERYFVEGSMPSPRAGEMTIWMVLAGKARLSNPTTGFERTIDKGGTTLVPAIAKNLVWVSLDDDTPLTLLCTRLGQA